MLQKLLENINVLIESNDRWRIERDDIEDELELFWMRSKNLATSVMHQECEILRQIRSYLEQKKKNETAESCHSCFYC